ncbi:MAG: MarC family protein [Desulfovibrio sp.]|nr:MarC family protein [Desulfovibrio sp.]
MTLESIDFYLVLGLAIKLYALLTPPAVLSAFIHYSRGASAREKFAVSIKTSLAIFILGEMLLLFGSTIFGIFGFTLDAFRIGVGLLLFLSAIRLMNEDDELRPARPDSDISVVPLAIPLGMGPSAIGTVIVLGASASGNVDLWIDSLCIFIASVGMALLLSLADPVERLIGKTGIAVMSKLTALLISAIAAQVIFTGIKAFLNSRGTGL